MNIPWIDIAAFVVMIVLLVAGFASLVGRRFLGQWRVPCPRGGERDVTTELMKDDHREVIRCSEFGDKPVSCTQDCIHHESPEVKTRVLG